MNGLYGYPTAGSMSGMQGMSGVTDEVAFIYAVADGSKAREIERMKQQVKKQETRILGQSRTIAKMSGGSAREEARRLNTKATVLLSKEKSDLNGAIKNYNEVAEAVRFYTAGLISPNKVGMSGLGLPQAVVAVLPTALIIAAVGLAIAATTGFILALNHAIRGNEGIISQTARALKAAGEPIGKAGEFMSNTAWAVVAITGAYVVYQLFSRGKTRAPKDPLGVRSPVVLRSPVHRKAQGMGSPIGEAVAQRPIITPPPARRELKMTPAWA